MILGRKTLKTGFLLTLPKCVKRYLRLRNWNTAETIRAPIEHSLCVSQSKQLTWYV